MTLKDPQTGLCSTGNPCAAFLTEPVVMLRPPSSDAAGRRRTNSKQALRELALLEQALDQAVIVAITDVKGRITCANDMFCAISGYSRRELIGRNHNILKSGEHSKQFFRDMYRQIANGKIWRGEICNRAKDGSLYWVDTTIVPQLGDHGKPVRYASIRIDITAKKRAMQALRASLHDGQQKSSQINSILANLPQGLCIYDGGGRIALCNEHYAQIYGLSLEDVKPGTTFQEVVKRRAANGFFVTEWVQEYNDERIASGRINKQRIDVLSDGRTILTSTQSMPDRGWVTLHQDITEFRRNEARIAFLAHHDPLTGLANRSQFKEKIERACAKLAEEGKPFSIMMLDLDRFKKINDSFGHAAGDDLLKQVALRLKGAIGDCDVLARFGGDEFAIVQSAVRPRDGLADVVADHRDGAIVLANRIIEVLHDPFDLNGFKAFIGTSIGISLAPTDGVDPDDLVKKADLALYDAKENGRNAYRFFNAEILAATDRRHRLEADMRLALDRGEFELHYQPIADVRTCKITGAEALVRWRHPQHGLLQPDHFIPLAEETGFIIPLGEWILYQACQDAAAWGGHLKLAVNLSAVQFRKCDLLDVILCALVDSGLPAERLEVEVTESVLLELGTDYRTLLYQLKNIGVSVALDDFGTGYSSLSYLKRFAFDKLKIDRSFTADIADKAESMAIVAAVIGLGCSLGMVTVAEGVESEEQLEIIRAAGVSQAQGYLFGKPRPNALFDLSVDRFVKEESLTVSVEAAAGNPNGR